MKKTLGYLAVAGLVATANAGSINVANFDIELSGGIIAGYFYQNNVGTNNKDSFQIPTAAVDLKSEAKPIGFTVGIGVTDQRTLINPVPENKNVEFEYGWVTLKPVENLTIDAGKLLTNIGYELFHQYENKNHFFGVVWNAQPVAYAGARATYTVMDGLDVYAEYSQNALDASDAFAFGVLGSLDNISYAVSYFDEAGGKNIVDIVASTDLYSFEVGVNFDYIKLDDSAKVAGQDDSGWGLAVYASTKIAEEIEIPVRVEYANDGTSDIYTDAGKYVWTFTVSPTYKPTKNTFARVELGYIKTDTKGFLDSNGTKKNNRFLAGAEVGFVF